MVKCLKESTKRIVIMLPSLNVGGAERLVFEELSYLKNDPRFYFEIHLVFEQGLLFDKFKELKIPIYVWNAPHRSLRTIITYFKIIHYLRHKRFDVIHIHLLDYFSPWLSIFIGLKIFHTIHYEIKDGLLERFCLRQSDVLFGCGDQVTNNLKRFIPAHKIKLLSNAIHLPISTGSHSEDVLRNLALCKDNRIVVSLGRLTRQKGYDILIEAFKNVIKKQQKAVLLIGGDGPDKEKLERQIIAAGITGHVRLLGVVNYVNELFEICDVYVNSSRWEGLPLTLLEAMAHKKPIVATCVGGNCEVVQNGKTGILVSPEHTDFLADAILKLLNNEKLRNEYGLQAFELFESNYTIEKHCKALTSAYLS